MPRTKMLNRSEELSLARAWLERGDERARARLVEAYQPLVIRMAKSRQRRGAHISDLIQEGNIGLLRCLDNFDPGLGHSISTLARFYIHDQIALYFDETSAVTRIPRSRRIKRLVSAVIEPIREIEEAHGVKLTREQEESICLDEGFEYEDLERYRAVNGVTYGIEGDDEEAGWSEISDDRATPEEALVSERSAESASRAVFDAMSRMPERTQKILRMRHFSEEFVSLDEIGEAVGISRARVRRIEEDAMTDIRAALEAQGFHELEDIL
ncbi:RNA polymerase sigma factor RpoS [Roseovarius sp. A-2]|uniref:sigma-70 family RNA polymerase sigma factor n=1 Tax=Roseovarius sp. A-2 TaxID=1570360 RepID=UPI0009CC39CA|nr:sigma-70 family RNA polymerase sigma factor [Roseovarius sp. A-2]GAW36988.1 RNA polymerase sigma factor RpoS [Roseovarius sp. A-2]